MSVLSPTVVVVDFGAQYAQLIARRVREAHVYSEIVPHTISAKEMAEKAPAAIIFSGGPASVHVENAPSIDVGVYELGIPILGICYGAQLMARDLGGEVSRTDRGEYGRTEMTVSAEDVLFSQAMPSTQIVWMSHFDTITQAPIGASVTASTAQTPVAAFEDLSQRRFGVQFHPEVIHTPHGQELLQHFLYSGCGLSPSWTMSSIIDEQVAAIRAQVGSGRAICGLSGGVDSALRRHWYIKRLGRNSRAFLLIPD